MKFTPRCLWGFVRKWSGCQSNSQNPVHKAESVEVAEFRIALQAENYSFRPLRPQEEDVVPIRPMSRLQVFCKVLRQSVGVIDFPHIDTV